MTSLELFSKDKKSGRTVVLIKDSNAGFANALRRLMLDSVPTMAIEDVEIRKNSSALYDEIIAHRLGLVPLTTDLKDYVLPQKCKCESKGCARCTVSLTLKAKGPGYVYASELKSKDPAVKPVYPELIVAKLLKDQELELEATAVLGQGKNHVKWSPGLVWHTNRPNITVNNNSLKLASVKDKYPPQVFKDGKIDKQTILDLNLVDAVEGIEDDVVKVEYDPTQFLIFIEPWGQLSAKEMLTAALDLFEQGLKDIDEKLGK